jgi:hypothetical protein
MSYTAFATKTPVVSAGRVKSVPSASGLLRIGETNDSFEREADKAAGEALTGESLRHRWSLADLSAGPSLQRGASFGSSVDAAGECGLRKGKDGENALRRKPAVPGQLAIAPPVVHEALNSSSLPLDKSSLDFFGRVYGHDFGHVRVHSDDKAGASAKAVGALAYAVGNHVVFDTGRYSPGSNSGRRLLAHELAHVAQRNSPSVLRRQPNAGSNGKIGPLVQKFIRGEATAQEKETLRKQLMADQLSPEEVEALKQYAGRVIVDAVIKSGMAGQPGQLGVTVGGPVENVHTYFKAKLKLRVSGATRAIAGGLEGTLETLAEVNADAARKKVTVYISAPAGNTMLAELVRAKVFSHGELTFELGEVFLKALNMISLQGEITVLITGKKDSKSGGLVVSLPDIPEDIELEATLSQSAEKPTLAPATGDLARPPIRAFVTSGVVGDSKGTGAATTLGFDYSLGNDTKNPLIYGGVGLRAGGDTRGGAKAGGAVFTGLNLNPVTVQLAFDAGIARFPSGQTPEGSGAKGAGYFGAEVSVGVRVSKHTQVMALASIIGGLGDKDLSGAGSAQVGVGYTF